MASFTISHDLVFLCSFPDKAIGAIKKACEENGYVLLITADHGNAELMIDEEGKPVTKHTTFRGEEASWWGRGQVWVCIRGLQVVDVCGGGTWLRVCGGNGGTCVCVVWHMRAHLLLCNTMYMYMCGNKMAIAHLSSGKGMHVVL